MYETQPWLRFYGDVPRSLEYPRVTLYEALAATVRRCPDAPAFDFLGHRATYRELGDAIDRCADGLAALGLRQRDRITISMPTTPQGVIAFYAANRLGAVPAMIHPLSTPPEIEFYLKTSGSRFALTVDAFYEHFVAARAGTPLERLILARIPDYLGPLERLGYWAKHGRGAPEIPNDPSVSWWRDVIERDCPHTPPAGGHTDDVAAILFSSGTTGNPKGIQLTHRNFIAEAMQVAAWVGFRPGDSILAVLPLFHGFGLGVCVNAALMSGGCSILVPQFSAAEVARHVRRARPNLLAGVPTLYDSLTREPALRTADLSCLRATFCGADTLPRPVKERFEHLVAERGGNVRLLEGYGLTEAVSAVMATPLAEYREGSVGIPFPDMLAKVVRVGTLEEVDPGSEGELCISGPSVMKGYLDDPEANAATLQVHADGRTWLHTGDLGRMDYDGYFYFTCRLKRMIKSSGFNVYPTQVEAVLFQHPAVADACVVGVPDEAQVERVKAYVVLKAGHLPSAAMAEQLIGHCREQLIKWSCPREVEFRETLPKTRVGKIDYRALTQPGGPGAAP